MLHNILIFVLLFYYWLFNQTSWLGTQSVTCFYAPIYNIFGKYFTLILSSFYTLCSKTKLGSGLKKGIKGGLTSIYILVQVQEK